MHADHSHGSPQDAAKHSHGEPYSLEEIEHFHSEDQHAARAIVTLMLAVFSLGFVGALTISIVVAG
ncbi:MAG TPA: hypothetical protein VGF55_08320 [Gemmataceae bacterium]|jgi:hypothetical protein